MQRRHLGDAVAVKFVRGAERHIPARNMRDGNMARRGGHGHGKNLKPIAEQQHGIGAAARKGSIKNFDGARNRLPDRLVRILFGKNHKPLGNRQSVRFNLRNGIAEPAAQVCARHHQPQFERFACLDFAQKRAQQAVLGSCGGDSGDDTLTAQSFRPPQNRARRCGLKPHTSASG